MSTDDQAAPGATPGAAPGAAPPSGTRRSMLAAALGGVGAFIVSALGRGVPATNAASGDPFVIGQVNDAGSSQSIILSSAGGAAFVLKDSAPLGTGVFGWSSGATGAGRGLYGRADSGDGYGLQAKNLGGIGGAGAAIDAQGGNHVGLKASTTHGERYAITAANTGNPGEAAGAAIYASSTYRAIIAVGTFNGVYGTATTGSGVAGAATSGAGVVGSSSSGTGVHATSTNGIGVYGNSATNWSGYFQIDARVENDFQIGGNGSVAGTFSKSGGSFKIDHPLDPAGKYLLHSFVESPDMLNVYNGIATLDGQGEADVSMPAWFGALNRDFRYQLTALGRPAPDLHVKSELAKGRFTIAGGAAGQRISWLVTGIRQDKWANANRIQVEEAKAGKERGTYLHPELFGQPATMRTPAKHPIDIPKEAAS